MFSAASAWILLGIILVILEFLVPGMILLFFGVGALLTGVLLCFFDSFSLAVQLIFFAFFSFLFLITLRKYTVTGGKKIAADKNVNYDDEIIGRTVHVTEKIPVGDAGKVELDGTVWNAVSDKEVEPGTVVKVVSRDGLTLRVESLS